MAETGMVMHRSDHFRFGSVFIKKKLPNRNLFLKKITETGSNRPVSVRFGFFDKNLFKPVGSVFPVWLGFFVFGSFFPVWIGFFLVWLGFFLVSVRFGFFDFRLIKPKPNQTGRFFQNFNRFNRFFFTVRFF